MKYETDVTLIDMMLAMTPEQRIEHNDRFLRAVHELRDGIARSKDPGRDTRLERD